MREMRRSDNETTEVCGMQFVRHVEVVIFLGKQQSEHIRNH
jgi:hypothetical protein